MTEPRNAIYERRKLLAERPAVRHKWPAFLVTAPHSTYSETGPYPLVPFGDWHARRVGSGQTICGRSAVTWQYFWTLDFSDAGPGGCPECLRLLRGSHD